MVEILKLLLGRDSEEDGKSLQRDGLVNCTHACVFMTISHICCLKMNTNYSTKEKKEDYNVLMISMEGDKYNDD